MSKPLNALIVEDNSVDAELLILELEKGGFSLNYNIVDEPSMFLSALESTDWDIIFSDHSMPRFNSFMAIELLKESKKDIPFIIVSGTIGEDIAVKAMKAGANDYLLKGNLERLIPAVERELKDARDRDDKRRAEWELEHFIAALTHDLRTPIVAENLVFESLKAGTFGKLDGSLIDIVEELINSNRFMQHMVDNMIFAYKYQQFQVTLHKECIDFAQYIKRLTKSVLIESLLKNKNLQLKLSGLSFEKQYIVNIDTDEMKRVLLNLVKNAIDYSPAGQEILVSMDVVSNFIRCSIEDFGSGINADIEPHLFSPYSSATAKKLKQVGTGLGLYLCKQIIESHDGRINYIQKSNQNGTIFYFELPLTEIDNSPNDKAS